MPEPTVDLAIVGAGPAGLAGAVSAADAGCRVTVLDLGARPGGQYWRHADSSLGAAISGLHHRWPTFTALQERFAAHRRAGRIDYLPHHAVWQAQGAAGDFVVRASAGERSPAPRTVRARTLLVATGAHDRHVPFEGWTLPGVMAVGGAQALLKGSHVVPGRRIVVAGSGPFLLSVADGLLRAGAHVVAVVEASHARAYARGLRTIALVPEKLGEAAAYAISLARHRVPYLTGRLVVRAEGAGRLRSVTVEAVDASWQVRPGHARTLRCDTLAVGFGFVPQLELALELGCATRLDASGTLVVQTDARQATSVDGVYAAGEPTGIGGADLSLAEGVLAGEAIAAAIGRSRVAPAVAARRARRDRRRLRAFAATLAAAHPVPDDHCRGVAAQTLVCRCEEVTAGEVRAAVALGAGDARAVKLLARPGMGWCQGRICGRAVAGLTAALHDRPVSADELRDLSRRPFAQPVTLGELAALDPAARPSNMSHCTVDRGGNSESDRRGHAP